MHILTNKFALKSGLPPLKNSICRHKKLARGGPPPFLTLLLLLKIIEKKKYCITLLIELNYLRIHSCYSRMLRKQLLL